MLCYSLLSQNSAGIVRLQAISALYVAVVQHFVKFYTPADAQPLFCLASNWAKMFNYIGGA